MFRNSLRNPKVEYNMVKMNRIRVSYTHGLVFEMNLQPDGTWSMRKGPGHQYKRKKKPNKHVRRLKSAYKRYLNR